MILSKKAKEAIKTALAMTIAYGVALRMGWDKPMWAGFAVAFISLETLGQSLNKGALRMLGTLVTAVVAFTIIALSAQERWLFMLFLSTYVGFCTYMMGGTKHPYFWNICGVVCVIICLEAGPNSVNAFEIAIMRAEETGLGVLVYSLVAILLWPSSSHADFDAATENLASTQHQLYRAYLSLMSGQGSVQEVQPLSAKEVQVKTRFDQLLDAAETDSNEVWELRRQWRRYQRQAAELRESMERWRGSFVEVQTLDLQRLLPNLAAFGTELDVRLTQIERMFANQVTERYPEAMDLILDEAEFRSLPHFHKAALAVTRTRLQHLEQLTRSLFENVTDIKSFGQAIASADVASPPRAGFVLDPDRITGVVRVMATLWLAYLSWIYVNDIPGGTGFVIFASSLGVAMANMPQMSVSLLFVPAAASVLFAGVLYIFVMPQLSSFTGLGLLIFAVTFAICYLFAAPRQVLGRAFGLAMFIAIASISNEQTYSFFSVANTAMMFPLIFLVLAITAYIPFDLRSERVFLRLLGRFFRSCEYLLTAIRWDPQRSPTRLDRQHKAFHAHEVATLPRKLGVWARFIDTKILSGTSPQQVQALVTSLQALSNRMQELLEARNTPQAQFLVQELLADFRAWRLKVQRTFQRLAEVPDAGEQESFRARLDQIMGHLEERIKGALDKSAEGQLSDQDGENFYCLLGAYRGVSEALVDYTGSAGVIDWTQWHGERF